LLSISAAAFAKVGEKRGTHSGTVLKPRVRSAQTHDALCRYTDEHRFHTERFSNISDFILQKKYRVPAGFYPTEDSSDEKDGSLTDCNSGASERRIDFFLCRRRRSDASVLSRTLRRQVSRKLRKA